MNSRIPVAVPPTPTDDSAGTPPIFPPKADETAAPSAEQNAPSGLDEDYNDHQAAYGSKVNSKVAAGGVGDAADLSRIEQELLGTEL